MHRNARLNNIGPTPGIGLFALFVFVLLSVPKLNVKFGPIPLYFIDILIVMLLVKVQNLPRTPRTYRRRFSGTITLLLAVAMTSELAGALTFATPLESFYIAVRTCLAFSVFFITGQVVRTPRDVVILLRAVILGVLITSLLMILTSLPTTRTAVYDAIFSHRFLEPSAEGLGDRLVESEKAIRGSTLVGVSILGATFINCAWPLAALFLRWPGQIGAQWRSLALAACILAPLGVLMSYSRGPILGSILVVLAAILLGYRYVRRGIVVPVMIGTIIVMSVGVSSQFFFFERLTNRTQAMFDNPLSDERESERLLAYSEPFAHLAANPRFLLFGEGVAVRYSGSRIMPEQAGRATHALFAIGYYSYGLLAAVLYLLLLIRAFFYTLELSLKRRQLSGPLSQSLFLSVVALVPWAAFGHAAISVPRGAMLFFLIFGIISSLSHFQAPAARMIRKRKGIAYAQRIAPAVR